MVSNINNGHVYIQPRIQELLSNPEKYFANDKKVVQCLQCERFSNFLKHFDTNAKQKIAIHFFG